MEGREARGAPAPEDGSALALGRCYLAPMPRWFNTAGPCNPADHYMLPALERLPEFVPLIKQRSYFVLHAPRQVGKTTTLRALAEQLIASGHYAALHFSCESGEAAGDDFEAAQQALLSRLRRSADIYLPEALRPPPFPEAPAVALLGTALAAWARACPRPLVLFFDEIDALRGQSLLSVLRQLRDGYPDRPGAFPSSVVLCGLRDVRDYKVPSGEGAAWAPPAPSTSRSAPSPCGTSPPRRWRSSTPSTPRIPANASSPRPSPVPSS